MAAPMVEVRLTPKLKEIINKLIFSPKTNEKFKDELQTYTKKNGSTYIPYPVVQKVIDELKKTSNGANLRFHELLHGTDINFPEYKEPERDPEYDARIQRLKNQASNREYSAMVKDVDRQEIAEEDPMRDFGTDMKAINKQLLAVFNFLITVAGAFAFGYKSIEYSMEIPNVPMQLCGGMVLATIVFFADLYFLLKKDL